MAAKLGSAKAQKMIGKLYERGHGVGKDLRKAVEWCESAAEWQASIDFDLTCRSAIQYIGHLDNYGTQSVLRLLL